jgi:nicotinamide mononucleotide adenylyltransferase
VEEEETAHLLQLETMVEAVEELVVVVGIFSYTTRH